METYHDSWKALDQIENLDIDWGRMSPMVERLRQVLERKLDKLS